MDIVSKKRLQSQVWNWKPCIIFSKKKNERLTTSQRKAKGAVYVGKSSRQKLLISSKYCVEKMLKGHRTKWRTLSHLAIFQIQNSLKSRLTLKEANVVVGQIRFSENLRKRKPRAIKEEKMTPYFWIRMQACYWRGSPAVLSKPTHRQKNVTLIVAIIAKKKPTSKSR